jgi:hypothetical protein
MPVGLQLTMGNIPSTCITVVNTTDIFLKGVFTGLLLVGVMVFLVCLYYIIQKHKERLVEELFLYKDDSDLEEDNTEIDE